MSTVHHLFESFEHLHMSCPAQVIYLCPGRALLKHCIHFGGDPLNYYISLFFFKFQATLFFETYSRFLNEITSPFL